MATLTADVTAEAISWNVSALLPGVSYLQVDDEIVRILDQRSTENRLRVQRGYAGTTAASHDSGAELVAVYVPSAGGGVQIIRLLGPFHIAHDTPNITTVEQVLADLSEGWIILNGLVVLSGIQPWDAGPILTLGALSDDFSVGRTIATVDMSSLTAATGPSQYFGFDSDENTPVLMVADGKLTAFIGGDLGTTGEADIYCLIADSA